MHLLEPVASEPMGVAEIVKRDMAIERLVGEVGQRAPHWVLEVMGIGKEGHLGALEGGEIGRLIHCGGVDRNKNDFGRLVGGKFLQQGRQIVAPLWRGERSDLIAVAPSFHERADHHHVFGKVRRRDIAGLSMVAINGPGIAPCHAG